MTCHINSDDWTIGNIYTIALDGAILNQSSLPFAYWEAKDMDDNLYAAVQQKRNAGYPFDNILFQNPQHGILYQSSAETLSIQISLKQRLRKKL